ncbi:MAG TPA: hypothetical protein VD813_03250 [Pseudonocardia sp.]|nr:hypothetical protein [Pseudonocardia sp.]
MSREHDVQLLESVAVRRNRLRESFLWGRERRVRATTDNVARLGIGVVLAAVLAAGCVGFSFVRNALAEQPGRPGTAVSTVVPR